MHDKFKNKYRVSSARLQNWDYSSNGAYFITICTKNKEHYFGNIKDGIMYLSEIGKLVEHFWKEIPNHFSFVEIGDFVVMPNHIHGILIINKLHDDNIVETRLIASVRDNIASENDDNMVETRLIASLRGEIAPVRGEIASLRGEIAPVLDNIASEQSDEINIGGFAGDKNPMFHDNVSKIIRWYKGRCTFEIRKFHSGFEWQSRFHDYIIRNAHSFENIQNYIRDNPEKWQEDKFF